MYNNTQYKFSVYSGVTRQIQSFALTEMGLQVIESCSNNPPVSNVLLPHPHVGYEDRDLFTKVNVIKNSCDLTT